VDSEKIFVRMMRRAGTTFGTTETAMTATMKRNLKQTRARWAVPLICGDSNRFPLRRSRLCASIGGFNGSIPARGA
jgi:hypothetical protein